MMKAKDFRQEQDYPYNYFTKLTNTGISPNYDNIEEFAEVYHQSKAKNLGLFSVSQQRGLLFEFNERVANDRRSTTVKQLVDGFIKEKFK